MYIPPTPYTPPSLANPAEPSERVTFYYRITVGELPAWMERLNQRLQLESRAVDRRRIESLIAEHRARIEAVEAQGDGARQADVMLAKQATSKIDALAAALDRYADVADLDMYDPTAAAELLAGVVHGWRDKDGTHTWPSSVADAAQLLSRMPQTSVAELLDGIRSGAYDEADVGKSSRRRAS